MSENFFFFLTQKLQKHLTKQKAFAACLCVYLFVPPISASPSKSPPSSSSSSSPSPPVCLAGGSDSQHPHCVVALFYSPSVSLSLSFYSLSPSFTSIGWEKGHVSAFLLLEVCWEVVLWSDVDSFCCILRIQCSVHTP